MTLPTYLRKHGYITAGCGKVFHPDACTGGDGGGSPNFKNFSHSKGDDPRAWSYFEYGAEANKTQEQWGTIPGPGDPVFNKTHGPSFQESSLSDEEQTDGMLATNAIQRFSNFSRDGIGRNASAPFFLSVGFHKPHLPHIVPKKYFDLYDVETVSIAANPAVPQHFKEENWHEDGTFAMRSFNNMKPLFHRDNFSFDTPIDDANMREIRRGYFAATSFVDAQVGSSY
jgi:arylsulfatase A-like enzyme